MNIIIFYEKPGCATNKKQKKILRDAGCTVIERNLMEHGMSPDELGDFIKHRPFNEWFNPNAPQIKTGHVNPQRLTKKEAFNLLFIDPILIRRPLMIIKDKRISGFKQSQIENLLNISLGTPISNACSSEHVTCTDKRNVS